MHFKKLFSILAVASNIHLATAVKHGELDDYNGKPVRWQQLAEGVFTGVPADDWDDSVNTQGDEDWVSNVSVEDFSSVKYARPLENRDLEQQCRRALECVTYAGQVSLLTGYNLWITLAQNAAETSGKDVWTFLNQPFVATVTGASIAGVISGRILEHMKECTDAGTQAAMVSGAVREYLKARPDASGVEVRVKQNSGSDDDVIIVVNAAPEGERPPSYCEE